MMSTGEASRQGPETVPFVSQVWKRIVKDFFNYLGPYAFATNLFKSLISFLTCSNPFAFLFASQVNHVHVSAETYAAR